LRLYDYAASGNCYKARLLLALLGVEYERVPIDIFGGDTLTDDYARINPARETPVLELDDGSLLAQSNAILWYLGEGTRFVPGTRLERAQVAQWLFFEQERMVNGIGSARFRLLTGRDPAAVPARFALGSTSTTPPTPASPSSPVARPASTTSSTTSRRRQASECRSSPQRSGRTLPAACRQGWRS
jgi:glutathione S-transferase